jgi:hypothetical protein
MLNYRTAIAAACWLAPTWGVSVRHFNQVECVVTIYKQVGSIALQQWRNGPAAGNNRTFLKSAQMAECNPPALQPDADLIFKTGGQNTNNSRSHTPFQQKGVS